MNRTNKKVHWGQEKVITSYEKQKTVQISLHHFYQRVFFWGWLWKQKQISRVVVFIPVPFTIESCFL
jgi:hypothetical protein